MYLCVCVFCMYEYVTCHHAYVRQDSYVCGTTYLYVRHDSLIVSVFVCVCVCMYEYVTCHHAYVCQDLYVCGTNHLYVRHDSLVTVLKGLPLNPLGIKKRKHDWREARTVAAGKASGKETVVAWEKEYSGQVI